MDDKTPITLNLELHEVNGILGALGELPTRTNAMFLIQKIQQQTQAQALQEKENG
jgi:hypothetical protein